MFPRLQRNLVTLYTVTTTLVLTLILSAAFLFYVSSQEKRQKALFQDQLFSLTSQLQAESTFTDSDLAQLELKHQLLILIEENNIPLFFPGSYSPQTPRETLFAYAGEAARAEGIYPESHPVSSSLLQTGIFRLSGKHQDSYLGTVLVFQSASGHKKLTLLQDITKSREQLLGTALFYVCIDLLGMTLFFLTGSWFVRRSLIPLEETCKKQQEFVAAASHELRSPLAVIQTAAGALAGASKQQERLLSIIKSECTRGSTLIKNLMLLTLTDQKNWAVKKQSFEIDELLLHLLELYEPLCHARGGSLHLALPESPLPFVWADSDLCRQILTILLDNAVAYGLGAEAGTQKVILLKAERSRSFVKIHVADHGPGVPDEEKACIFDRFYRGDKSRSKKEHFGLGLSVAAALTQIQDLRLEVRDTPGGGSTFSLTLPACRRADKTNPFYDT